MGGNIFKDSASPISRDCVRPTFVQYIRHLGTIFPQKAEVFENFVFVGSSGKKEVSGDLDLAIDKSHFFRGQPFNEKEMLEWRMDYTHWRMEYLILKKRARSSSDSMLKWKAFLMILAEIIRQDFVIHVSPKITTGNIFTQFPQYDRNGQTQKSVQIDWMIGDADWLSFAYYSGEKAPLKGLHRTQLMVAMASVEGYTFVHTEGIKNKTDNKFVARKPQEAIKLFSELYGPMGLNDTKDFASLHSYLHQNSTEKQYDAVIKSYLGILKISKAMIPKELYNENIRLARI